MGRQLYLFLIFNIVFVLTAISQKENSDFLFDEYKEATIYFSSVSFTNEKVNYNTMDRELYYIDKSDGLIKIVMDMLSIRVIKIDNRTFLPSKSGLQELLNATPPIYVEYLAKVQTKAQNAGYGSTSQVSAITTYSAAQNGLFVPDGKKMEQIGFSNCYWIEQNGKKKRFANFKQLLKIYPKHKGILDGHIKENIIDFNDTQKIVELCIYAESLK